MVRYQAINSAWMDIMNQYLEDLYTSDLDFSEVKLFTSLQQRSFTSYGNDAFSNISLLMEALRLRFEVNSVRVLPQILERIAINIK